MGPFLTDLRVDVKARRFTPLPERERVILKSSGKLCRLGIPTVRDRVVQAAFKLVLEPIFEPTSSRVRTVPGHGIGRRTRSLRSIS